MLLDTALRTYLLTKESITDLVGTAIVPQSEAEEMTAGPDVVYDFLAGERLYSMSGANALTNSKVKLDCRSTNYDVTKSVADALRNVLDAYHGAMGDVTVQAVFCDPDEYSIIPPVNPAEDLPIHVITVSITVWWNAAEPTFS